jgi:hypothetical protein
MRVWRDMVLWRIRAVRDAGEPVRRWVVRAARGRLWARAGFWGFAIVAGLVVCVVGMAFAADLVHRALWDTPPSTRDDVLSDLRDANRRGAYVRAFLAPPVIAGVMVVVMRLVWLRARARRVLAARGVCVGCGFGLAGVPLDGGEVACPECVARTPAVEAWNERGVDGQGRAVFAPAAGLVKVFWTGRRLKRTGKGVALAAMVAAVAFGAWWGVREVGIRRQAAQARAERPAASEIDAALRMGLTASDPPQTGRFALLSAIEQRLSRRAVEFRDAHQEASGVDSGFFPNAQHIWRYVNPAGLEGNEKRRIEDEYAIRLLDELLAEGLVAELGRVADVPLGAVGVYGPAMLARMPTRQLGHLRGPGRLAISAAFRAAEAEDLVGFNASMRAAWEIGETTDAVVDGGLITTLSAVVQRSGVMDAADFALGMRRSEAWIDAVETCASKRPRVSLEQVFRAHRLVSLDHIAWFFSEPSRVRGGARSIDYRVMTGAGLASLVLPGQVDEWPAHRPGTFAENREAIDTAFDWAEAVARSEPFERSAIPPRPSTDLGLAQVLAGPLRMLVEGHDQDTVRRRGLLVRCAIERHRLRTGAYPVSLEEVTTPAEDRRFVDPFSGRAFVYRVIDPAGDRWGRGYLLWSTGPDGKDDGGRFNQERGPGVDRAGPGFDIPLNEPGWW